MPAATPDAALGAAPDAALDAAPDAASPVQHRRAVWLLLGATLLWSTAGVVTRHLDAARGFEVTFWRSAFNAVALVGLLGWLRGSTALRRTLATPAGGGRALWLSGLCWAVMFTAFMLALTLTTVANVLVTMSVGPLFTALGARLLLGHRMPARTWTAIAVAGAGIAWMYGSGLRGDGARAWLGSVVALAVPLAAAANWTVLQQQKGRADAPDMLGAVLIGAVLSACATLPLAWPLQASPHDLSLLALLGVFQLAVPCLMAVSAARVLSAPEAALLGLLEVVFGVLWTWLGAAVRRHLPRCWAAVRWCWVRWPPTRGWALAATPSHAPERRASRDDHAGTPPAFTAHPGRSA